MRLLLDFLCRFGWGMAVGLVLTPASIVPAGFFRVNLLVVMGLATGAAERAEALMEGNPSRDASDTPLTTATRRALAAAEREIANIANQHAAALAEIRRWGARVFMSESRGGDITDVTSLLALGEALRT